MDPISAMIMGGASLIGGFMNSSSQQAANAANIQLAQQQASGAFLPSLVQNAERAGINPLAALGSSANLSVGRQVGTDPGSGLMNAARQGLDVHADRVREQQIRKTDVDIANARQLGNNAAIDGVIKSWTLNQLSNHPEWVPNVASEPASTTSFGIPQIHWMENAVYPHSWNNDPTQRSFVNRWDPVTSIGGGGGNTP